eukprot:4693557-Prymnesium_polylepis.2
MSRPHNEQISLPHHANTPPRGYRDVHALAVEYLKEVARVEIGLRETLDVDELVHGCAVPDAPRVGLAVQGHLEPPHERHAAVVEDAPSTVANPWQRGGATCTIPPGTRVILTGTLGAGRARRACPAANCQGALPMHDTRLAGRPAGRETHLHPVVAVAVRPGTPNDISPF